MPGRNPHAAYQAFVEPLERAIACVAKTKIIAWPRGHKTGVEYGLRFPNGLPVALDGSAGLLLDIGIKYEIVSNEQLEGGRYKVKTLWYQHTLSRDDDEQEIVGYHWHPVGNSHETRPHVHIGSSQLGAQSVFENKHHIMTGRCSIEQVVRTAIEFGAEPRLDGWSGILDAGHSRFVDYRSWH